MAAQAASRALTAQERGRRSTGALTHLADNGIEPDGIRVTLEPNKVGHTEA